jgi:hypothetical protein
MHSALLLAICTGMAAAWPGMKRADVSANSDSHIGPDCTVGVSARLLTELLADSNSCCAVPCRRMGIGQSLALVQTWRSHHHLQARVCLRIQLIMFGQIRYLRLPLGWLRRPRCTFAAVVLESVQYVVDWNFYFVLNDTDAPPYTPEPSSPFNVSDSAIGLSCGSFLLGLAVKYLSFGPI